MVEKSHQKCLMVLAQLPLKTVLSFFSSLKEKMKVKIWMCF